MLILLLGGARSGKSSLACALAGDSREPVTFIATAEARDDEFARRIERHRRERPTEWAAIEAPIGVTAALSNVASKETAIVDCLTLWVANLLEQGRDEEDIVALASAFARQASTRPGLVVAVSNEVGSGIVPTHAGARHFRDVLGRVNAAVSLHADQAFLVVAGRALALAHPSLIRARQES